MIPGNLETSGAIKEMEGVEYVFTLEEGAVDVIGNSLRFLEEIIPPLKSGSSLIPEDDESSNTSSTARATASKN